MFGDLLFRCTICEREIYDIPRNGRDCQLSPICRGCESRWTERMGKPKAGSFMDRRKAMQIAALAEALHSKAASLKWSAEYGRT